MADDRTREGILLRRARFVTAALAGLAGCNPTRTSEPAKADPSARPIPSVSATASASAVHEDDLPEGLPPLETPAGVSAAAKEQYERLDKKVRAVHVELAKAANLLPSCAIADEACKKTYREVADHLVTAKQEIDELGPRCAGESKDAKAVDVRVEEHRKFAKARLEKIKNRVMASIDAQGAPAKKAWDDVFAASEDAHPQACLKFACGKW